jgi:hypothetical protein
VGKGASALRWSTSGNRRGGTRLLSIPTWVFPSVAAAATAGTGAVVQYILRRPEVFSGRNRRRSKLERICKMSVRTQLMLETLQEGGGSYFTATLLAAILLPVFVIFILAAFPGSPWGLVAQGFVGIIVGLGMIIWMGNLGFQLLPSELHPKQRVKFSGHELARVYARLRAAAFSWFTLTLALTLSVVAVANTYPAILTPQSAEWAVTYALALFLSLPLAIFYYTDVEALDNRAYDEFVLKKGGPIDVWVEVASSQGKYESVKGKLSGIGSELVVTRDDKYEERIEWQRVGRVALLDSAVSSDTKAVKPEPA